MRRIHRGPTYFVRLFIFTIVAVLTCSTAVLWYQPNSALAAPPMLGLQRVPWEGGSSYWSQFAKANAAGWDDPNFFPIGVFLSDPQHAAALKDAGVNTYVGVNHGPPISNVTNEGMFVIAQGDWLGPEWTVAEIGNDPNVVGWLASDECEMGFSGCETDADGDTDIDEADRLLVQQDYVDTIASFNDGRFTFANFGNGVLRTFWAPNTMDEHVQLMDVASADKYAYTSEDVRAIIDGVHDAPDWPNGTPVERAYAYGWLVDQMKRFQDPDELRPVWGVVETAQPLLGEANPREILPDEIEGAVWSSIIHEARGLMYFQHNNSTDTCTQTYSIVDCPVVNAKVTAINAKVQSLAPVLNTQSYYNDSDVVNGFTYYRYTFNNSTDTMLKTYNGSAYIFAGLGMGHSTGSKTFELPSDVDGDTVTVVGEARTIPVVDGEFTDTFANEYSHHVYQVALGADTAEDDTDNDGINDSVEDAGPNGGDANGDGTQDSIQANVAAIPNNVSGGYNALVASGNCDTVTGFSSIAEGGLSAQDSSNDYPVGLWDFSLDCTSPGGSGQVTIYLNKTYNTDNWVYRKFDAGSQSYTTIPATFGTANVGGTSVTTITITVQDGGPLDEDGATNGQFTDPSGPAVVVGAPLTGLSYESSWPCVILVIIGAVLGLLAGTGGKRLAHVYNRLKR